MTLDATLFNLMNSYGAFDVASLMAFISNATFAVIVLSALPFIRERQSAADYIAAIITAISFSIVLQQFFAFPRPPTAINPGSPYSFPSTHSTSAFAWAGFMGKKYRPYELIFYLFAALVAVSRVYIGVHYPIDVLSGAILGWVIAVFLNKNKHSG